MKIFYFYDDSAETLQLKNQFENSLPKDLEPYSNMVGADFCQKSHGGGYYGWTCKYNTVLNGFNKTKTNDYFIFSDIDVKFYSSIKDELKLDKDWYFQQETSHNDDINIGFMIIKNCENSQNFWHRVNKTIEEHKYVSSNNCYKIKHKKGNGSGQFIVNDSLKDSELFWDRLPLQFWSGSIGLEFLSKNIIIHHANAVHGIRKKMDQLNYVSQLLSRL